MGYVVEASHLTKTYGKFVAVDDVTLKIGKKEIFGLVGPNGAGKTTLLLLITGLRRMTSGSVQIFGLDIKKNDVEIKKRIGVLNERLGFLDNLSVFSQLLFVARVKGLDRDDARREVWRCLEKVNMSKWANVDVGKLSAGMRQRVAIAQMMIGEPELLICDEPTSNLDPMGRETFFSILEEFSERGATIVIASHLLFELERICTTVAIMNEGKIIRQVKIDELASMIKKRVIEIISSNKEKMAEILGGFSWISNVKVTLRGVEAVIEDVKRMWVELPKVALKENVTITSIMPKKDLLTFLLESAKGELQ